MNEGGTWRETRKRLGVKCLLHLANNLTGFAKRFDHLLTLLPPPDGVVALLEEVIESVGTIHILEQLTLHLVFGKSAGQSVGETGRGGMLW